MSSKAAVDELDKEEANSRLAEAEEEAEFVREVDIPRDAPWVFTLRIRFDVDEAAPGFVGVRESCVLLPSLGTTAKRKELG